MWTITGFADEVTDDFGEQLTLMTELGVRFIELRSAWGIPVLDLPDARLRLAKQMLDDQGIAVSALNTDLGMIAIDDDFATHLDRARRAADAAWFFETSEVRGLSFRLPSARDPAACRGQVIDQLGRMASVLDEAGARYLHENDPGVYGDRPQRCADLAAHLDPHMFRLILDPANYVRCHVHPVDEAYPLVRPATVYIHVGDAVSSDGSACPAGNGDGQLPQLLHALHADGFDGYLSIEPQRHAAGAPHDLQGPGSWRIAHKALIAALHTEDVDWA